MPYLPNSSYEENPSTTMTTKYRWYDLLLIPITVWGYIFAFFGLVLIWGLFMVGIPISTILLIAHLLK